MYTKTSGTLENIWLGAPEPDEFEQGVWINDTGGNILDQHGQTFAPSDKYLKESLAYIKAARHQYGGAEDEKVVVHVLTCREEVQQ